MNIKEMIRQSIEDSEKWREGRAKPGAKPRRATRPADRGGSPERPNRAEEQLQDSNGSPRPPRPGSFVRVVGFIPLSRER
jgi:hypothetical protein